MGSFIHILLRRQMRSEIKSHVKRNYEAVLDYSLLLEGAPERASSLVKKMVSLAQ